jgi:hypothetical protein
MANYCENRLRVSGQAQDLARFQAQMAGIAESGETSELVFDAVLPAPLDLEGPDLWAWRKEHWGVEAAPGPHDVMLVEDNDPGGIIYIFPTKWTAPRGLVAALATRFPELTFDYCYTEFDSRLAGHVRYKSGQEAQTPLVAPANQDMVVALLDKFWPEMAESAREYYAA